MQKHGQNRQIDARRLPCAQDHSVLCSKLLFHGGIQKNYPTDGSHPKQIHFFRQNRGKNCIALSHRWQGRPTDEDYWKEMDHETAEKLKKIASIPRYPWDCSYHPWDKPNRGFPVLVKLKLNVESKRSVRGIFR
ncbi:MAG: hypothetical protein MUC65_02110 [Pontiellaceae bacterium]|nr:hypothetical protein [Pontiellaceae bacterium]